MGSGPTTTTNQSGFSNSNNRIVSDDASRNTVRNDQRLDPTVAAAIGDINSARAFGDRDPNSNAARNLIGQTLQGDFLPGNNTALEGIFNQGADKITNRLNTSFSRAGRNTGAARPVAADELGSFRAQLFGPAFENERNRQTAAIGQSQQFNPLDQFLGRLQGLAGVAGNTSTSNADSLRDITSRTASSGSGTSEERASFLDRAFGVLGLF